MAEVFLCAKGQLTGPSKAALRKAGVVVVEVEDPDKCQFIRSTEVVSSNDMLWAAVDALNVVGDTYNSGKAQREQVAKNLLKVIMSGRNGQS